MVNLHMLIKLNGVNGWPRGGARPLTAVAPLCGLVEKLSVDDVIR